MDERRVLVVYLTRSKTVFVFKLDLCSAKAKGDMFKIDKAIDKAMIVKRALI